MAKYSEIRIDEACLAALESFVSAMFKWEAQYYAESIEGFSAVDVSDDLDQRMRRDLKIIFESHVIELGRNYERVENLICGYHPEYDLDNDEVVALESEGGEVSVVITKTKGLRATFKITLGFVEGVCKVKRRELSSGNEWIETYI
ncbi:NTF2 fold immunity protein [Pseudomonas sp. PSKL.D1]|uniref:NTF2 fold immunity protein n=1 Tax=Pseudomonas sp. PSKL.D1 TaxID=3029060 RepID=UPI0023811354|nr:NTF2 fold immunity protein [Pseudomonas sp. PSKL.D1]WDY57003.1 NTF2 fold immunity protein [Pseudomonas sp. PSKL.D1]